MNIGFNFWASERDRWFLWIPVAFGLGIGVYFNLFDEPPIWTGAAVTIAATAVAVALARRRQMSLTAQAVLVCALATALAGAGFSAAQWRTQNVATPILAKRLGPVSVSGQVVAVETYAKGLRVTLTAPRISGLENHLTPSRVRLRLRGKQPEIRPGDWLRARASLTPPSPPSMPGAFDFQRQAFFKEIGAVGFAFGPATISARAGEISSFSLANIIADLRTGLTRRIMAALPEPSGAIAAALITGERRAIPAAVIDAIRDSGLAHLLAISGLHIGLVAGLLFAAIRAACALIPAIALRYPIKKWAAVVGLAGGFAYALIAGATLPTQRAFLMIAIALLGIVLDRRGVSLRAVAWAALVVLAVQPESLLSASFQMSFAAVTALVAVYEGYAARRLFSTPRPGHENNWLARRVGVYVAGVLLTTLVAGLATGPFAIYHFNRIADYSLVANLLAVPLTALWVMPWAIVAMVLMPLGAEQLGLMPMAWGIEGMVGIAETISAWPGAVTLIPAIPTLGLGLATLGAIWLAVWRGRQRFAGIPVIGAGLMSIMLVTPPDIIVDSAGRLVAVRADDGRLLVSSLRRAGFERDMWMRRLASTGPAAPWPNTGRARGTDLICDAAGCLLRRHGKTAALIKHERALAEDCWRADAVISVLPIRAKCPAGIVIDRFDLWREGAHAIWLDGPRPRVETVNGQRGHRPWVSRRVSRPSPRPSTNGGSKNRS